MTENEFFDESNYKPIILPQNEYAHVISEINTNLSGEERQKSIVVKPIGDYYYTFINRGFSDYIIIGKSKIINDVLEEWEEGNEWY